MKMILTSPARRPRRDIGVFAGAKTVLRFSALPPVTHAVNVGAPARLNFGGFLP